MNKNRTAGQNTEGKFMNTEIETLSISTALPGWYPVNDSSNSGTAG